MNAIVERTGWLLIHSVWQFALLALIVSVLLSVLRKQSSALRYGILTTGLAFMVVCPVFTWYAMPAVSGRDARGFESSTSLEQDVVFQIQSSGSASGSDAASSIPVPHSNGTENDSASLSSAATSSQGTAGFVGLKIANTLTSISRLLKPWLPTLVTLWSCGVLVFSIRPAWGWYCVRQLLKVGTHTVETNTQELLSRLCKQMRIRRKTTILASSRVCSPVVVGCLRSVILIPSGLITGIPTGQLEAILAHELAHIRRFDFSVNLLQSLIETLFFYHPAVWWLSHRIRLERENCCDDLAVSVLGNRIEYGRALLALEEFRGAEIYRMAPGVRGGSLLARVRRLLMDSSHDDQRSHAGLVAGATFVCVVLAAMLWSTSQTSADETTVVSSRSGGEWQITPEVHLQIDQQVFHGADVTTTAVLIWKSPDNSTPRHCRIPIAADLFANRNVFAAVWETGRPVLWFASGWRSGREEGLAGERIKADQLHRVDFSDPFCVVDHVYSGWPEAQKPSEKCMSELNAAFMIEPVGKETYRYYQTSLPGTNRQPRDTQKIYVFLDADGRCRVSDPQPGKSPEKSCTIATLTQTLDSIALRMSSFEQIGGSNPLHVVVGSAPEYPEKDLDVVLAACKAAEMLAPQRVDDRQAQLPWRAFGRVTDGEGNPLAGVTVRAATGIGTLRGGGSGLTDENGRYDFRFGMGILIGKGDDGKLSPQTQYALISARLAGYFEKEFSQQGNGIASLEPLGDEEARRWGVEPEQVCLPNNPREVNFVMLPAARMSGTLIGEDDQPLKDYSVSLVGEKLPPGSSVLSQVATDSNGHFEITEIPTSAAFQIEVRKPRAELRPPWDDSWATASVIFADPGENDLATVTPAPGQTLFNGVTCKRFRLKIVGPGVPGKTALASGLENWRTQDVQADSVDASGRLMVTELTLILNNEVPTDHKADSNPVSPKPTKTLPDSLNVMSVGFDQKGQLWSIAARQKVVVRSWNVESGERLTETELETNKHANHYLSGELQFSDDRSRILAIDEGKISVWNSSTGKRLSTLTAPDGYGAHRGLSCSRDFSRIACGMMQSGGWLSRDANAVVWDANTGQQICTVSHPDSVQIHCTAITPDGRWLATGSQEAGLCVWDLNSGSLKHQMPNDNSGRQHPDAEVGLAGASQVVSVCFSPDGRRLAMSDMLGVKVFDTESGQLLHDFPESFRFGRSGLVFSTDGNLLARVGTDQLTCLWNLQTGRLVAELNSESHSGSFSNDKAWFAVGFTDESHGVRLWRISEELTP